MAKSKMPFDAEFDRQFEAANAKGQVNNAPRARSARYDETSGRVVIELMNGCMFAFPAELGQGLRGAAPADLGVIEVSPSGLGLRWPRLDADLLVGQLVAGVFGSKAWMHELGRAGGQVRSDAKAAAARANGAKGGRPRKEKPREAAG